MDQRGDEHRLAGTGQAGHADAHATMHRAFGQGDGILGNAADRLGQIAETKQTRELWARVINGGQPDPRHGDYTAVT